MFVEESPRDVASETWVFLLLPGGVCPRVRLARKPSNVIVSILVYWAEPLVCVAVLHFLDEGPSEFEVLADEALVDVHGARRHKVIDVLLLKFKQISIRQNIKIHSRPK